MHLTSMPDVVAEAAGRGTTKKAARRRAQLAGGAGSRNGRGGWSAARRPWGGCGRTWTRLRTTRASRRWRWRRSARCRRTRSDASCTEKASFHFLKTVAKGYLHSARTLGAPQKSPPGLRVAQEPHPCGPKTVFSEKSGNPVDRTKKPPSATQRLFTVSTERFFELGTLNDICPAGITRLALVHNLRPSVNRDQNSNAIFLASDPPDETKNPYVAAFSRSSPSFSQKASDRARSTHSVTPAYHATRRQ